MADPWAFTGESPSLQSPGGVITLVEGPAFCLSTPTGDMTPLAPQGLFFRDTRFLSRFELLVNGHRPEPLAAQALEPSSATFVGRIPPRPGQADSSLVVFRNRYVGRGMREDIAIRNYSGEAAYCSVELRVEADFTDLFAVKEGRFFEPETVVTFEIVDGDMVYRGHHGHVRRGARISFSLTAKLSDGRASFEAIVPAKGTWTTCVQLTPILELEEIEPRYLCGQPIERAVPEERLSKWRRQIPVVATDCQEIHSLIQRSGEDLGALRIFDPEYPERAVVAAGAPWFMTLFGRDAILASWMALIVDPDLALGVLQTLARFQGTKVDARLDEEPGKILHEVRFGHSDSLTLGGGEIYYGSADATPLFVMLLGELRRWGLARELVDSLLPAADRAMEWIFQHGDRDGDGYVEYQRATDRGLVNQGWKDSWDGVRFADGTLPQAPIALCEVQGYVYSALLARAYFAQEVGDVETFHAYRQKALNLKDRFNEDFWLDEHGWFAMGLDRDKKPIDALASNMGHCLWTGIVDEEKAPIVAERLLSPELFGGWGIRTLASSMVGYNPISYHCGSVWPHDNAICAAGLMRYGFVDEAHRVINGLLDAARFQGYRLPELYGGLARGEVPFPVEYPSSCSPQAWAAASPLMFLRTILRLDPWVPHGRIWLDPVLPERISELRVERIPLAGSRVTVEISDGNVKVEGLPAEITVHRVPRRPVTEVAELD